MAQTKSKSKPKAKPKAQRSGSSRSKANGSNGSQAKAKASQGSAAASNGVADSIKHGEVGPLVRKAKVPLLASGAAIAGVAGAVVATRSGRRHNHKVLGVSMPKGASAVKPDAKKLSGAVVDAAKRADRFGQGVSRVASSVRDVSEAANKAAKKG